MKIIKEELRFEENLKKRLEFICDFSKVNPTFVNGSIRKIEKTNIPHIAPLGYKHEDRKLVIDYSTKDIIVRIFDNNDSDIVHNPTRKVLTNAELAEIQTKKGKKKNDYNLN